ncbi:MAG: ComEA family DNA-binding protein [Ilumatobacteraceae bacterium]
MDDERDWRGSLTRWWQWFGGRRIAVVVFAVPGAVFVAWWLLRVPPVPIETALPFSDGVVVPGSMPPNRLQPVVPGSDGAAVAGALGTPDTAATVLVHVHVVGAVVSPGVYALPAGARGIDALHAAGGALPSADLVHINLAVPLVDAVQLYAPQRGERRRASTTVPHRIAVAPIPELPGASSPAPALTDNDSGAAVSAAVMVNGRVRLNVASAKELDALPGVGPTTAAAIVEHRRRNGPYRSVDDLDAVNGIGPARIAALRDLVVID